MVDPAKPVFADAWRLKAACLDRPELFFVSRETHPGPAKAICAECVVQPDCLDYALKTRPEFGIWAGYTTEQLRRLRRKLWRKAS